MKFSFKLHMMMIDDLQQQLDDLQQQLDLATNSLNEAEQQVQHKDSELARLLESEKRQVK